MSKASATSCLIEKAKGKNNKKHTHAHTFWTWAQIKFTKSIRGNIFQSSYDKMERAMATGHWHNDAQNQIIIMAFCWADE